MKKPEYGVLVKSAIIVQRLVLLCDEIKSDYAGREINLPISPNLTTEEIEYVASVALQAA